MMRRLLCLCFSKLAIIYAEDQSEIAGTTASDLPKTLAGLWTVRIENLQHQVVTTMTIEFTADQATSCMSGDWKRIAVKSHDTSDRHFFPVTERLSYELEKGSIVIGRNEWCDDYLHLKGELPRFGARRICCVRTRRQPTPRLFFVEPKSMMKPNQSMRSTPKAFASRLAHFEMHSASLPRYPAVALFLVR
jgi:hypothetical protein